MTYLNPFLEYDFGDVISTFSWLFALNFSK